MTDIAALVARLRKGGLSWNNQEEAADALEACQDEIERLRAELMDMTKHSFLANYRVAALEEAAAHIDRLIDEDIAFPADAAVAEIIAREIRALIKVKQ